MSVSYPLRSPDMLGLRSLLLSPHSLHDVKLLRYELLRVRSVLVELI